MANNVNDIVAKMSGQDNSVNDEFVTEAELTDILYKLEIEKRRGRR